MTVTLLVGLLLNLIALPLAARRAFFLYRVISSGQPAPDRIAGVTGRLGVTLKRQVVEVFGQKKLLKWTIPGVAHSFVFWAFLILGTVYLEAYAVLLSRDPGWNFLVFGNWWVLGFVQDFIAVLALVGIAAFWAIRLRNQPQQLGRKSRFFGSHLGPAYFTLFMVFNVVWSLFLFRGAIEAHDMARGEGGYGKGAFVSYGLGKVLPDSIALIGIGLILHIGVMLVFLLFVLNSKHLHIFVAPLNVMFGRYPIALGAAKPMMNAGKPLTLEDLDDVDEDTKLGVGAVEDFSWKGLLDFTTCTECGRCQDQCPAWNTEKPLSPKLLIMNLRDHALAKAPYTLANGKGPALLEKDEILAKEVARPLIGDEAAYGVIDPDVLWSCVTCGACVQQCPVDIEHVDHIIDMRRYQVLVESNFPPELNGLFKGMESRGNPWNLSPTARMEWAQGLDFEVKVVGDTIESLDEVDWLFWVGCAGAYEDRAKKTTRAVAELLDRAGVSFGVLGNGETCTGDSARRAGNEFVFQGLAAQNVETFKEYKVKQVVTTCAHCFNTLKNEYSSLGVELEVVHHTQLLNRLVREGKLTPVASGEGAHQRTITWHDPCYIGRHNGVYTPPRELLEILPGADFVEMPRNSERSFCCGAGGARMWMEESIGSRINENRSNEAVATGADQIAVGCPFCRVMLSDGLTSAQANGRARAEVEVLDVAQMLLASVRGEAATKVKPGAAVSSNGAAAPSAKADGATSGSVETKDEPEAGDVTITDNTITKNEDVGPLAEGTGGGSLFDTPEAKAPAGTADEDASVQEEAKAATPASSGGSLFDVGSSEKSAESSAQPVKATPAPATGGGSLFDVPSTEAPAESAPTAKTDLAEPDTAEEEQRAEAKTGGGLGIGGSLFDVPPTQPTPAAKAAEPAPSEPAAAEPSASETAKTDLAEPDTAEEEQRAEAKTGGDLGVGGSLFDIKAPEPAPARVAAPAAPEAVADPEPAADPEPEPEPVASTDEDELRPTVAAEAAPAPTDEVVAEVDEPPAPAAASPAPKPRRSMFDLATPEALSAAPTPATGSAPAPAAPAEPAEPTGGASADDGSGESAAGGAAVTQTSFATGDTWPDGEADSAGPDAPEAAAEAAEATDEDREAPAEVEAETEPETAAETATETEEPVAEPEAAADDVPAEAPKPPSTGPVHTPRTDADISGSSSLFDL